jgi:hypothetical protein
LNKNAGSNPIYRGGGSIGIIGAARSGLLIAKDPDNADLRVLASTKCNLAKLPSSLTFELSNGEQKGLRIGWIGPCAHTAESLLAAPKSDEERSALQEAVDFINDLMANGPVTAKHADKEARKAGVADKTLRRAKTLLKVESHPSGFGNQKEWSWYLPFQKP